VPFVVVTHTHFLPTRWCA